MTSSHASSHLSRSSSGKSSSAPHLHDEPRGLKNYNHSNPNSSFMELTYRSDLFRSRTSSTGRDVRYTGDQRPRTSSFGRENRPSSYQRQRTATISQDSRPRTSSMGADTMRPRSQSYSSSVLRTKACTHQMSSTYRQHSAFIFWEKLVASD